MSKVQAFQANYPLKAKGSSKRNKTVKQSLKKLGPLQYFATQYHLYHQRSIFHVPIVFNHISIITIINHISINVNADQNAEALF